MVRTRPRSESSLSNRFRLFSRPRQTLSLARASVPQAPSLRLALDCTSPPRPRPTDTRPNDSRFKFSLFGYRGSAFQGSNKDRKTTAAKKGFATSTSTIDFLATPSNPRRRPTSPPFATDRRPTHPPASRGSVPTLSTDRPGRRPPHASPTTPPSAMLPFCNLQAPDPVDTPQLFPPSSLLPLYGRPVLDCAPTWEGEPFFIALPSPCDQPVTMSRRIVVGDHRRIGGQGSSASLCLFFFILVLPALGLQRGQAIAGIGQS